MEITVTHLCCRYRIVRSHPIGCRRDGMRRYAERNWIKRIWRCKTACLTLRRMKGSFSQASKSLPIATPLGLSNACCKTVMAVLMVILTMYTRRSSCTFHLCFVACIACWSKLGCLSMGHCLLEKGVIYENWCLLYSPNCKSLEKVFSYEPDNLGQELGCTCL